MNDGEALAYLNGEFVPRKKAVLPVHDAGIVWGATVTEMTRTIRHRPYRLDQHLDRLFRSVRYTRLEPGLSRDELLRVSHTLVEHHARRIDPADDLALVHFVTAGELEAYADTATCRRGPSVCAHTFTLPFAQWADKLERGAHVVTPSIRHVPPQCYDPKMKYRSRMHFYLADQEARLVDSEAIALLLDVSGNVTETSGANFLIVERGALVSPRPTNILAGVSRATLVEIAGTLGMVHGERDLQVYDVVNADEALLTSTPYCLLPVTRINGIAIGDGAPGPVFGRLSDAWNKSVGMDIGRQIRERAAASRH